MLIEKGTILIAETGLQDFYFNHAVVLLIEHNETGSFGLILNKPTTIKVHELIADFPSEELDVYIGGPVKKDSLFMVHRMGDIIPNSEELIDGVYWGGDFTQIKALIAQGVLSPKDIRFYLGYAGWVPNQLEEEMEGQSWVVSNAKADYIFDEDFGRTWMKAVKTTIGKESSFWGDALPDPSLN